MKRITLLLIMMTLLYGCEFILNNGEEKAVGDVLIQHPSDDFNISPNTASFEFLGTYLGDVTRVTVRVNSGEEITVAEVYSSTGQWSYEINPALLSDGEHTFTVSVYNGSEFLNSKTHKFHVTNYRGEVLFSYPENRYEVGPKHHYVGFGGSYSGDVTRVTAQMNSDNEYSVSDAFTSEGVKTYQWSTGAKADDLPSGEHSMTIRLYNYNILLDSKSITFIIDNPESCVYLTSHENNFIIPQGTQVLTLQGTVHKKIDEISANRGAYSVFGGEVISNRVYDSTLDADIWTWDLAVGDLYPGEYTVNFYLVNNSYQLETKTYTFQVAAP